MKEIKTETIIPKNGKFFNTIYRMQLVKRFPDFKPRFNDNTASHSFRVSVLAFLIALSEKKKYGKKLDLEKIVCRAIFHDFNEHIVGSIKHKTKKDPRIAHRIKILERKASEKISSYVSDMMKADFYDFLVNAEDDSPEGEIVRLADTLDVILFSIREIEAGNTFHFPKAYKDSIKKIEQCNNQSAKELLQVVLNKEDPYREFIMAVLKFDQIDRWSVKYNLHEDEDAMHTFRTAAIGIFFALYEKRKFNQNIDIYTLVSKILFHDLQEAITGDIQGPLKHQDAETKEDFNNYEKEIAIEMVNWTPDFLHEELDLFFVHAKDDSYEGIMVNVCDKIDALVKSLIETRNNLVEYQIEYLKQLKSIQMNYFNYEYVKFFTGILIHDLHNPWFEDM